MERVAQYVARRLADLGVRHVFMLTGGGAMFLNDAFAFEPRITPIFNHHEQACAMAAEGYARVLGTVGVINVTTGPGGLNALNGVFGAWTDSVPMLIISGQVKRETMMSYRATTGLRQLGDQETDTIRIVAPLTKYAKAVTDPAEIRYELDRAFHIATSGRHGPCWLDIPIDVQAAMIEAGTLREYEPGEDDLDWPEVEVDAHCDFILDRLSRALRPVIMAGTGVRVASAVPEFVELVERLGMPVVTAWTHDLLPSDHPLYCGRPGTIGTRAGNFTVQNADCLLVLGSRLNIRQTSYNWPAFASRAFKIQVDIDAAELTKPTLWPDHAIRCDLKHVLPRLIAKLEGHRGWSGPQARSRWAPWVAWCKERERRYPVVQPRQREFHGRINPYHFMEVLFGMLGDDDIIVTGNATACIVSFQVAKLKRGQRLFSNSGAASMGHDLPAAIGAAIAAEGRRRVICLAGDGSIMLNIQELQTLYHYNLPIKLIILNNEGYLSMRTSQMNFFKRAIGESATSGLSFPDFTKVGNAFGLATTVIDGPDFAPVLAAFLESAGPGLADARLDGTQQFEPRMSSRQLDDGKIVTPPLEDMFPFLPRDELAENMIDDVPRMDTV